MADTSLPERVALTGATGFIGRHLVTALVARGCRPALLCRAPREPLHSHGERVRWIALDLLDGDAIAPVLERERPEVVFHLAGTRGPGAAACASLNVAATARLLEACGALGVRRVVLLGSAEEYGAQDGPLREDMPLRPLTFYGITKAAATSLALAMHAAGGCPAVILRPFTVYGPGQPKDMFVAEAVEAAVAGEPFRMSQGEQRRDFIYVQDLVEALLASALAPGLEGHVVNVGTGRARRLRDVAERIWQLTGSTAPLLVGARPASPHQLHDTWADTSAARRLLGWQPRVELDQGLAEAIEWCRMSRRSLGAGLVR